MSARADDLEKNKKLDFSPRTSELLDDLIAFVRNFSVEYPREAKVSFQRGFQWRTRLTEDHLLKQPDGRERFNYRWVPLWILHHGLHCSPPTTHVVSSIQLTWL